MKKPTYQVGLPVNPFGASYDTSGRASRLGEQIVSAREQALINALKAIVAETMAYPATRPQSSDSYLPEDMVLAGISALGGYGVTLACYREVS